MSVVFGLMGAAILLVVSVMVLRPRKKLTSDEGNDWQNRNFQKRANGGSFSDSPPETTGYLGGGD